jgi:hypothetical protein
MAKSFIYPVKELYSATYTDGTHNGTAFSVSASITDEDRLFDQSLALAVSDVGSNDAIKIDLGSAIAIDALAIYFTAAETSNASLYGSANADTSSPGSTTAIIANFDAGWTVAATSDVSLRYWALHSTSGTLVNLTEFFIGRKYDFDFEFDLQNTISKKSGSTITTTYSGSEFSTKKHDPITTWSWKWSFITAAMKTSLEALRDNTEQDRFKFVYYDGTDYHWVRMSADSLQFTEVAHNIYSTTMSLTQQLI